jgi:Na+/melibiose symporter-like transporter
MKQEILIPQSRIYCILHIFNLIQVGKVNFTTNFNLKNDLIGLEILCRNISFIYFFIFFLIFGNVKLITHTVTMYYIGCVKKDGHHRRDTI